ncbi:EAL domain-containing protein [Pseudonocardia sp. C8]|nr:EAL domain-containing protein [Pseudonocardia sp. C8]MBC3190381.1 EAL domain-containing protein [Pseudonocardia sp. C8]
MSRDDLLAFLRDAAGRLVAGVAAGAPDDGAAGVGAALVDADLIAPEALPATVEALGGRLAPVLAAAGLPEDAAPSLLAAVAGGYTARLRARILDEQEMMRRAEQDARGRIAQALSATEARFHAIFANAAIGIGIADLKGRIVDANQAFASMLGYTIEEFCRLRVEDFVYPDDAADTWRMYEEIITGERDHARVEKRYRHRDGHFVWTELTASLIRDAAGEPQFTVAMVEDITHRRELQQRLSHQATHDPLTGLPNRTLFQERLAAAFARAGARIGVCYLDLDRFKAVNDRLGHDVGDRMLVSVAARLDACVSRHGHLVARMGGDEFVVLAVDPRDGELDELAGTVLEVLAEPIDVDGHRLRTSASIGVVECPVAGTSPAEVLKSADVTLYWAKADGRNRWARFDPERNARDMTRYALSATLLPGLENDEFVVEYQQIVGLRDGRPRGIEALVRWEHPTFGRLSPDRFIDLAEESGAIVPLGRRVLAEACERVASWNAEHPDDELFVSVNLAVRQAQEGGLVEDVAHILDRTGLPPRRLQLELTESALLGPPGRPVAAISALAELGVRIAVDDFGTGYSHLSYLPLLPLHTIKLARELVEGIRTPHSGAESIVDSMVGLAHSLGMAVTAEGVETCAQRARLRAAGCDTAQGWLYGRAVPWPTLVAQLSG